MNKKMSLTKKQDQIYIVIYIMLKYVRQSMIQKAA